MCIRDSIQTEANYTALETALQNELANIERTHPGYDEYRYDVDSIGHNPNEPTGSFLDAILAGIKPPITVRVTLTITNIIA